MTFVAEWGDRSQITTIILSARENLWGVITGGIIGHAICTGLGVVGGRMIAQKISVRTGEFIFIQMQFWSYIKPENELTTYMWFPHFSLFFSDTRRRRRVHTFCYHIVDLGSQQWRFTRTSAARRWQLRWGPESWWLSNNNFQSIF